jgi:diguanylate cyclase (GGDEF)-like protein
MEPEIDPILLPLIDAAMQAPGVLATIPDALRARYRSQQLRARRRHNGFVVIGLMIIFDLFWLGQLKSAPELASLSGVLRLTVMTPACLLFLALDWRHRLGRFYDLMLVTVSVTAALITALLCVRTTSLTTLSDVRATPLILLTTGLLMRISPPAATANSALCAAAFIGSIVASKVVPRPEIGSLVLTDLAIASVTLGFSMMLEQRDRTVFLLRTSDQIHRAELAVQNRGLRGETLTDALTGVANRRCFDETLAAQWHHALQAGEWIGLIMLDIDHFKAFNDEYGHQGGDDCLRLVAERASTQIRTGDMIARYGGEEFVVVLPGAPMITVAAVAERIRAGVEGLALRHAGHGAQAIVTVSLGGASVVPSDVHGIRRLVEMADQNLYDAKRGGRNRVGGDAPRTVQTSATNTA